MMRDKRVFTVTRNFQGLLLGVDGLTLKKAVANFPELMKTSLPSKRSLETTQTPPIHQQEQTKLLRQNEIQESLIVRSLRWQQKKGNEGMKVNFNICCYQKQKTWDNNVKVEIIVSPNARKYMQCPSSKIMNHVMTIVLTSSSWL